MPLPATSSSPRAPPPPRGMIRRLGHRLRRDTGAGTPQPGGEMRKCSRWGRAATDPALWASQGPGLTVPRVIDPALSPGGARLHTLPLLASWRKDEKAELGRGSRRGVGFLSLPTRATPAICPGGGRPPRLLPAGVALPDHASRTLRSGVPSSAPPSRQASLGLERRLGVGGP